jgi:septum formation protein
VLILASASPRRRDLLEQIGLTFEIETADIDETPRLAEDPTRYTMRLAEHKAAAVMAKLGKQRDPARLVVLGADTTVVCEGQILGKPADEADAVRMLRLLSGKMHQVITGVALVTGMAAPVIEAEEPMGKAGSYGIQGRAARFIPRIEGCYFNVVGLPLARVSAMLDRLVR